MMDKKKLYTIMVFLCLSCNKENKKCLDEFNELYVDRYSLWFNFEKDEENLVGYDNHTISLYEKRKKELNDNLALMIDCALKENMDNELLYLYKMKILFLNNQLKEISIFFNEINKNKLSKNIYFQLLLYKTLSDEIIDKEIKVMEYQKLKKIWIENDLGNKENNAMIILLDYLISDDKKLFFSKIEEQ